MTELWNIYGPTETTIWSTRRAGSGRATACITIGRPIANTQLYVLDAGQPVAVGVAGEIWIGGDGVALGYHRRPELTAERFVPDRFSGRPARGCTAPATSAAGCRRRASSTSAASTTRSRSAASASSSARSRRRSNAHPMVRQSAVITREARPGDMRIVAYVVVNHGEDLTVSEVRRYLRASLPDYMIPSFVMTLQALPLTANGKLDRGALPDPFRSASGDAAVSEPPAPGWSSVWPKSGARR